MKVPLVDLKVNFQSIEEEIREGMEEVLGKTMFAMGPILDDFEQKFASYCESPHAIGVSSGLEALTIALRCLGVGPGDEVVLPANTFIATALGVSAVGATPVLVDVDPKTDLVTAEGLAGAITSKTKVLMPVHLYGRLAPMPEIQKLASEKNLLVIEDAAQAHGAKMAEGKAGTFGIAAGFSFFPGKNLGAFGDGGAITTPSDELAKKIKLYRNYGSEVKYYHEIQGSNNRLDTLQAAVLRAKLRHLDTWNGKRLNAARRYDASVQNLPVERPELVEDGSHVYHLYPIRLPKELDRDQVLKSMNEMGIGAGVHYPIPVHLQKAYEELPYKKGDFPVTEDHAKRMISLPVFPEITEEQQEAVVTALKKSLEAGS
jgi:dTDP-4-amino-4,6-dideoxygalactose transaminase